MGLAQIDDLEIDLIVCSDLGRTRHTLLRILDSLGESKQQSLRDRRVLIFFNKYVREGSGGVFEERPIAEINTLIYNQEEDTVN